MQQHSGQHLISAMAEQNFGWETTSWWLGENLCNVEFKITKKEIPMTENNIEDLNAQVNQIIRENHKVIAKIHEESQKDEKTETSESSTDRKSTDRHHGSLRVVSIGNLDQNPCCGTHISHTSELQAIYLLRSFEKARDNYRVFFHVGNRAIQALNEMYQRESKLKLLLSCAPEENFEIIKKIQKDHKNLIKVNKSLWSEIAEFKAEKLVSDYSDHNHRIIACLQNDCDILFLSALAFKILERKSDAICFLLCSNGDDALFLLQSSSDDVSLYGKQVSAIMDGRGGGKNNRYQGKVKDMSKYEEACKYLQQNLLK